MSNDPAFSDISYQKFLSEEKLMGCKCSSCGKLFVPPRPICLNCSGKDMEWIEMPIRGTLCAFTCVTICPPAMMEEGYNRNNPYCSGVVELEEGLRVDARIEGVNPKRPEDIHIGMQMEIDFIHLEKGGIKKTCLAYRPIMDGTV